jgi:arginine/lysine/ornithine decarboxylase
MERAWEKCDNLFDRLTEYGKTDYYPMHMPGHKRNTSLCRMGNPYELDITEIEGFDNLHQPEGVLLSLAERMAGLFGSGKAFPLVNGSTAGILAGMMAATNRGDQVLLARNSHKSVYHGVILGGLLPNYIYPQKITGITPFGGFPPSNIEKALINNQKIKLVIISSPSYEGVVSDIKTIADIVHKHGARLLVDEAHGAHFGFHEQLPVSAIRLGADLVIQSLHKTLPAFTQTAVLHSNCEELNTRIEKYLAVYQSSSPSYLLMAGIDRCISLLENNCYELFTEYLERLSRATHALAYMKHFRLLGKELIGANGVYTMDPSKLTVIIRDESISGKELSEILYRKYHLVLEMASSDYILGMTSICDTEEGLQRFVNALIEIDRNLVEGKTGRKQAPVLLPTNSSEKELEPIQPMIEMLPCEAWEQSYETVDFISSGNRCSASFVCLFPPGQPLLVPGEIITADLIAYIMEMKKQGITVTGLTGPNQDKIEVIRKTERIL